ncbi:hypothetical protein ABMA57_12615 [Saccharospirillum sp. HFRX-1]|uniref:hypothetical protein n=1 Tax=unclassified Saccharospirillum TaxID=2633430 RepID=UPI003723F163
MNRISLFLLTTILAGCQSTPPTTAAAQTDLPANTPATTEQLKVQTQQAFSDYADCMDLAASTLADTRAEPNSLADMAQGICEHAFNNFQQNLSELYLFVAPDEPERAQQMADATALDAKEKAKLRVVDIVTREGL